jgi:hypothetical protein
MMINDERTQDLIARSAALIEAASLLPNPAINRNYLLDQMGHRGALLSQYERYHQDEVIKNAQAIALHEWSNEVERSLHTLLDALFTPYGASLRRCSFNENKFYICAPVWDKWKNAPSEIPETIATVQAITTYEAKHGAQSWKRITHRGHFLEVTINKKTSRHTNPDFKKIARSLFIAVREKSEIIEACEAAKVEKAKKANGVVETFGEILPLEVETVTNTFGGNNPRTAHVEHTLRTAIKPVGPISGGTISSSYKTPGAWDLTLQLRGLDELTAKAILEMLAKATK